MANRKKVIISCAVTGAIHTPTMSPYLPISANEIAESAIEAAEAGAAILHLHARHPETGRPSQDPALYEKFLSQIKRHTNAVINISTGGSPHMSVTERAQAAIELAPELASLNMGSMNFGLYPMLGRYSAFKYDWEYEHLENSRDLVFRNTYQDIEEILGRCRPNGTRFEFECYDTAHLYNLKHISDRQLIDAPFFIQTVFGLLGGIGAHPEDITHMRRTADRLFGEHYRWSVLGAGAHQMRIAAMSLAMNGNIRVGLEDSLWIAPGELAESNAAQVKKARALLDGLSLDIATPDDTRQQLALKGADEVRF